MSNTQWPPALKEFINRTFSQCTDTNRQTVEKELRQVIQKAFEDNTLWNMDWDSMQLESLSKKPPKRKKEKKPPPPSVPAPPPPPYYSSSSNKKIPPLVTDTNEEYTRREKRLRRFEAPSSSNGLYASSSSANESTPEPLNATYDPNIIDWDKYTIVGTSTALEKSYLRLTTLPDPATIRPLHILERTFEMLKRKWKEDANYNYIVDQFKSLRQDLTVQRIKTLFTVDVYQVHARIALEKGDLSEYNQCQSQLNVLYEHYKLIDDRFTEFVAYRILYMLHTKNRREFASILSNLSEQTRSNPYVIHALDVQKALATSNYHRLFRLYKDAPNMGAYLMDHFVSRERVMALAIMSKAYHTLPLAYIAVELAFGSETEAHEFLDSCGAAFYVKIDSHKEPSKYGQRILDSKSAYPILLAAQAKHRKIDILGQV